MENFKRTIFLSMIALMTITTISCSKDDDEPKEEKTTADLTFKFEAVYIDAVLKVKEWDVEVMLYDGTEKEIESKTVSSGTVTFEDLEPNSYYIKYLAEVKTDDYKYGTDGYSGTVRLSAGDSKTETVEMNFD
jgi:hypothetical protein